MEVKTELVDQELILPEVILREESTNSQTGTLSDIKTEVHSPSQECLDELSKSDSKTPPTTPQCPSPMATPDRQEKSLGILTTKFVQLLQDSAKGELDLKAVSDFKLRLFLFVLIFKIYFFLPF